MGRQPGHRFEPTLNVSASSRPRASRICCCRRASHFPFWNFVGLEWRHEQAQHADAAAAVKAFAAHGGLVLALPLTADDMLSARRRCTPGVSAAISRSRRSSSPLAIEPTAQTHSSPHRAPATVEEAGTGAEQSVGAASIVDSEGVVMIHMALDLWLCRVVSGGRWSARVRYAYG